MYNLKDVITLAKNGYKPNDIKELVETNKDISTDDLIQLAKAGYKPSEVKELITITESFPVSDSVDIPDVSTDPVPEVAPEAGKVETVNYKELYESTKMELEKVQKDNIHKDISGDLGKQVSNGDRIKAYFTEFMQ